MLDILILVPEITKGMKSLGSKALLKIKNSTMVLEYQIEQLRKIEKRHKIFIGIGFEADKIRKLFVKNSNIEFIQNSEYAESNQGKIISNFINNYSSDKLLVISNGIIFKNNPFVCDDQSKIFLLDKPKNHFSIGCHMHNPMEYLFYDLPIPWTECVFFNRLALDNIKDISNISKIDQMYLFELINNLIIKYQTNFIPEIIKKKDIMKINNNKDIQKAKLFI